jgi:hypothetical protein
MRNPCAPRAVSRACAAGARASSSSSSSSSPSTPWGLTPRYAARLPPARFPHLPTFSPLGVLDRPPWQAGGDASASARSYMDAMLTPRDEHIVSTLAAAIAGEEEGGPGKGPSKKSSSPSPLDIGTPDTEEKASAAAAQAAADGAGAASSSIPRGGRRRGGRTRSPDAAAAAAAATASAPAPVPPPADAASPAPAPAAAPPAEPEQPSAAQAAPASTPPPLLPSPPSNPPSPSLVRLLSSSTDAFRLLFAEGMPHVHRPLNAEVDEAMLHPDILSRLKRVREGLDKAANLPPQSPSSPPFPAAGRVRISHVAAARIVDAWSAWDCVGDDSDINDGVSVVAKEMGHSVVLRSAADEEDGDSGGGLASLLRLGLSGTLLRFASRFVHFYGLIPPKRVHTQVTVAYLCAEERLASPNGTYTRVGATVPAEALVAASSSAAAAAGGGAATPAEAAPISLPQFSAPHLSPQLRALLLSDPSAPFTVHTVTYEAHARIAQEYPFPLLAYLLPQTLAPSAGWRVVDIDGHWAAAKGHAEPSFSPILPRARQLAWRRAALEMRAVEEQAGETARMFGRVAESAAGMAADVRALRDAFAASPAGRRVLDAPEASFAGLTPRESIARFLAVLAHATRAAADLQDAGAGNSPWTKRAGAEKEAEGAGAGAGAGAGEGKGLAAWRVDNDPALAWQRRGATGGVVDAGATGPAAVAGEGVDFARFPDAMAALDAFLELSPNAQKWAAAAYKAVRGRVAHSMGELQGLQMDVDTLYKVAARAAQILLSVAFDAIDAALPVKGVGGKGEAEGEGEEAKGEEGEGKEAVKEEGAGAGAAAPAAASSAAAPLAASDPAKTLAYLRRLKRLLKRSGEVREMTVPGITGRPMIFGKRAADGNESESDSDDDDDEGEGASKKQGGRGKAAADREEEEDANDPWLRERKEYTAAIRGLFKDTVGLVQDMTRDGFFAEGKPGE